MYALYRVAGCEMRYAFAKSRSELDAQVILSRFLISIFSQMRRLQCLHAKPYEDHPLLFHDKSSMHPLSPANATAEQLRAQVRELMEHDEAREAAQGDRVSTLQEMLQYTQRELAQTQDAVLRATEKAIAATNLAARAGLTAGVTAGSSVVLAHVQRTDSSDRSDRGRPQDAGTSGSRVHEQAQMTLEDLNRLGHTARAKGPLEHVGGDEDERSVAMRRGDKGVLEVERQLADALLYIEKVVAPSSVLLPFAPALVLHSLPSLVWLLNKFVVEFALVFDP
jgi:hypothetical protein